MRNTITFTSYEECGLIVEFHSPWNWSRIIELFLNRLYQALECRISPDEKSRIGGADAKR